VKRRGEIEKWRYVVAALSFLVGWWILSWWMKTPVLPPPWQAGEQFVTNLSNGLALHLAVSLYRVVISLILGILLAVPLGMVAGRESRVDQFVSPLIYLVYPIPKIVLLPILLIILGIGDISKVSLIAIIVFFQILVTTRDAAKTINQQLIYSLTSLGAHKAEIYKHVVFPACLPKILTSLRISLGTALAVLFFAEAYATRLGIGYYIMDALARFDYGDMFAGVIGMSILGLFLFLVLDWLEQRLCLWQYL